MRALIGKGSRLFTVTQLLLILAAAGHTSVIFGGLPDDPGLTSALDGLKSYEIDTGISMRPTLLDVFAGAWVQVGGLLAGLAIVNLAALAAASGDAHVKKALLIADLVVVVPMAVLFVVIPIPQPAITFGVVALLLGLDLVLTRSRPNDGPLREQSKDAS